MMAPATRAKLEVSWTAPLLGTVVALAVELPPEVVLVPFPPAAAEEVGSLAVVEVPLAARLIVVVVPLVERVTVEVVSTLLTVVKVEAWEAVVTLTEPETEALWVETIVVALVTVAVLVAVTVVEGREPVPVYWN